MSNEITTSTDRIYRGRVVSLRVDTVRLDDGAVTKREIVEHRGAVAMVALDERGNVLLVRQFRKAAERSLLEIPAGTLEAGEDPLACAQRELQEETGFSAENLTRFVGFYPCPGYSTEFIHLFLATGLKPARLPEDEDEQIELVPVPLNEALQMIGSGDICDAKTIIGLLTYSVFQTQSRVE